MKVDTLPSPRSRRPLELFRLLWHLPTLVRLFWRLLGDKRVGLLPKALLIGALIYVASPIDLLDDFLPVIGVVDDLALLLLAGRLFIQFSPRPVVEEHLQRLSGA